MAHVTAANGLGVTQELLLESRWPTHTAYATFLRVSEYGLLSGAGHPPRPLMTQCSTRHLAKAGHIATWAMH